MIQRSPGRIAFDTAKFLLFLIVVVWLIQLGIKKLGYDWHWYRVGHYLLLIREGQVTPGVLLQGLAVTFRITGVSLLLAFTFGLVAALFRLSHSFGAKALARGYIELIRNTPLLTQLFFMYFVISPIIGITAFTSAVLSLSLFEGAYIAEIIRSGIISIDTGQWEAAFSQGLSSFQVYRHVVLPQAMRRVLPPLTSQAISLIKDSALVSTIAIYDLTMQGQAIVAETFLAFEIWFTVAALYLAVTLTLSYLVGVMERKIQVT